MPLLQETSKVAVSSAGSMLVRSKAWTVDGAGFALDADALAVEVVEASALAFQGRGHRWDLEEVAGEVGEGGADGGL